MLLSTQEKLKAMELTVNIVEKMSGITQSRPDLPAKAIEEIYKKIIELLEKDK
jgi:predicted TIM-barrel fold metal-dependent hydrolase